ncbi:MAG TPA: glucoamylase family protein, partial [Parachlamydiaceae bacterium]|nr:glucoamylase family protein [Parachlamydiaceae bacterium]
VKYALFSDFIDCEKETKEDDCKLLEKISQGIHSLNKKYGEGTFFLFHRQRVFAPSEGVYMGKERKRGKLEELNCYLLDKTKGDAPKILYVGKKEDLKNIRFVLTVDADTELPKDSIKRLIETAAHPLNYPVQDKESKKVVRGYTLIQPRMATSLPSANATYFSRIFSGAAGADPYSQAISDIYQDLNLEGTYHGKGIYDLRMFHERLNNRFPDAHILSHDLLEGAYVRVGFASGIELFDEFPESYLSWAKREHRWMRGDWQILDWLFSTVPSKHKLQQNSLSWMNKWKIFDNARRSLLMPSLLLLALGTAFLAKTPTLWFSLVWFVLLIPTASLVLFKLFSFKQEITLPSSQITNSFLKALTFAAFLPHMAYNALDAIVRALYRKHISKKNLLEWVQQRDQIDQANGYNFKLLSLFAILTVALTLWTNPVAIWSFLPFLLLWLLAPFIAKKMGAKIETAASKITEEEKKFLRQIARKTWRFFETFTGDESNHLPPDNYQESHTKEVAYRTSPTNIGLYLLSLYSALDFGYITLDEAIKKSLDTLNTLLKMEKHEGHLLNWYDIKTLEPLLPRYVSTVDSGNFLACLYALKYAVKNACSQEILTDVYFKGLEDTLSFLPHGGTLREKLKKRPLSLPARISWLTSFLEEAKKVREENRGQGKEAEYWSEKFVLELEALNTFCRRYLNWAKMLHEMDNEELKKMHPEAAAFKELALLDAISLEDLSKADISHLDHLLNLDAASLNDEEKAKWHLAFCDAFSKAQWFAGEKMAEAHAALEAIEKLASEMQMKFLYNKERRLFSIGYNVTEHRLDSSYYDLLASEARLSSLVAIARNDVPVNHWWALGRPYAKAEGFTVLLSWGGTMFEYLMPMILSKTYEKSLLDNACKAAVSCQIAYAKRKKIPWGISESAYCGVDARKTYQYKSFGVPKLGLKRGLEDDLVVSPYSSALSLLVEPKKSIPNLKKLMHQMHSEVFGKFGFFESIDYTRQYDQKEEIGVIVRAYMAHHQGMIFTALNNCLHDGIIQKHFHQDPRILSIEPLLYERLPSSMPFTRDYTRKQPAKRLHPMTGIPGIGKLDTPNSLTPKVNLLSNGNYSVMVTNAGGGFSKFNEMEITRWQADTVCDSFGSFIYIKDLESKKVWSLGYQPTLVDPEFFAVNFTPDKVEFIRRDFGIELKLEITVSPEDNVEVRRITFMNLSKKKRYMEATSYMELSLTSHEADRMHPAYNKMFIETESLMKPFGLMATRRKKREDEPSIYVGYLFSESGFKDTVLQFETDRRKFIGRGHDLKNPEALDRDLTNTEGSVLDPIFSLRRQIILEPGEKTTFSFALCLSDSKEKSVALMQKYHDARACNRAFEMAWVYSQLQLRYLRILPEESQYFQKLGSKLLYPQKQFRTSFERVWNNRLTQSNLWPYGISGDLPILTVIIADSHDLDLVKQVLVAHSFLNLRGLKCDLIFINEEASTYDQPLKGQMQHFIHSHGYMVPVEKSGQVHLLSLDQMPKEDVDLILSASRAVLIGARGLLQKQLTPELYPLVRSPLFKAKEGMQEALSPPLPFMELKLFNGIGGFTEKGDEYV